jgi:NADPH:quinone reductase
MKAVVVDRPGGPEELRLVEVATPSPGPGEVTIDVTFAGVGFVDTLLRRGKFNLPLPLTPGIEVAGVVREVGEGVGNFRLGEPVAALLNNFADLRGAGGYAEVALARADLTMPLRSPEDAARSAAVLINGTTAWLAIHALARVGPGETVLVLGAAGGLGALLGQLSLQAGASRLIGTTGSEAKRTAAQKLGYHDVLLADELPDFLRKNGGQGVDVVFDPVGGIARRVAFEHLAPFGRQVILGNASDSDTSFPGDEFWHGTKSVHGLSLGRITHRMPDRVAQAARQVLDLASERKIAADPERIRPLSDAAETHRLLEARSIAGKIVLRI